ncbi:MAG: helix-turn-helix transcriptional regulator [Clostridiales bacterium]|nr:helix-turn-helix transcriptional regulator [Clostridiales bacterium]
MIEGFAERITSLRHERNISQKEAAAALGVSQALLSHYENDIRECGLEFVCRAADYYGVTADYILGRTESRYGLGSTDLDDLPEDVNMTQRTVTRAAVMVQERISAGGGSELEQMATLYYSICVYRAVLAAVSKGIVPKKWIGINSKSADALVVGLTEELAREFVMSDVSVRKKTGQQPLCIKTVVDSIEEYMRHKLTEAF